jgi:predicted RNase H-like nuclease (RuvC/YqgF family)
MGDIYDDLDGELSASEVIASLQKRIEELEALISQGFQDLKGRDVADCLIRNAELEKTLIEAERDWEEERRKVRKLEAQIDELPDEDDVSDLRHTIKWLKSRNDRLERLNNHYHTSIKELTVTKDEFLDISVEVRRTPCRHVFRNVTGKPWLKCMECGEVIDT